MIKTPFICISSTNLNKADTAVVCLSHPAFSVSNERCSSLAFRFTSDPSFCSFCTSCCTWSRVVCNSPTCDSNFCQINIKTPDYSKRNVYTEDALSGTHCKDSTQTLLWPSSCSVRCSEAINLSLNSFTLASSCVHCSCLSFSRWACSSTFF